MTYIAIALATCCVVALVWYMYSHKHDPSDDASTKIRQRAYDLVRSDPRLAQVIMLLSYSDMDTPSVGAVRRKSNRRLVLEIRQITRGHFPDLSFEEVNKIAAQLLIIARNIGRKRRQKNADVRMSKCE